MKHLAAAAVLLAGISVVDGKGSYQSGPLEGNLYAGGLDFTSDHVYVTGITYDHGAGKEASCFLSRFDSSNVGGHPPTISSAVGNGGVMEACRAMSLLPQANDNILVAGTCDPEGIYGSGRKVPSGFLMGLSSTGANAQFAISGGLSTDDVAFSQLEADTISYPVSVLYEHEPKDPYSQTTAYVASITANDAALNPKAVEASRQGQGQPNWIRNRKYGSAFEIMVQKFYVHENQKMEANWTRTFPVKMDIEGFQPDVFLGGMIMTTNQRFLVLAGNTRGFGRAYGDKVPGSVDQDGFLVVLDTHNGRKSQSDKIHNNQIRIGSDLDDLVLGICDDPNDSRYFYIVGSTQSDEEMGTSISDDLYVVNRTPAGSMHGFVQKRMRGRNKPVWARQWKATSPRHWADKTPTATAGISCVVGSQENDPDAVYVAGIVEDGAHIIRDGSNDHFHDDVMAMRLDRATGEVQWLKQFGSVDGYESLARSGALALDENGDLLVYGETNGSMFRENPSGKSQIFLATLSKKNGRHDPMVTSPNFVKPDDLLEGNGQVQPSKPYKGADFTAIGKYNGYQWDESKLKGIPGFNNMALGVQTGGNPASEVFAGGMVYNLDEDAVYLTGIFYEGKTDEASCKITKLPLEGGSISDFNKATTQTIGGVNVLETCNTLALHGYGEIVVVGSADKGSGLPGTASVEAYPMVGYAMALDQASLDRVTSIPLMTSKPDTKIQYPIDVVRDGDDLYVVSLTSTDSQFSREYKAMVQSDGGFAANWMNMEKYGSSVDMTISKIRLSERYIDSVPMGDITFTTLWTKEFPMNADPTSGVIPRVYLGGAIINKDMGYLAVAGSTRGIGDGYGDAVGNDEDGFITLLDLQTGELSHTVQRNNIREGTDQDDVVLGMCRDPVDADSFYIVGATKGPMGNSSSGRIEIPDGSQQAFLRKVNANDLSERWTVLLGAIHKNSAEDTEDNETFRTPTVTKAFDCVAHGGDVYMAGVVDDNARIVFDGTPRLTRGGDDIWVAKVSASLGTMVWARQAGTLGNDHVAPRGALALSKTGGVLLYGDTTGAFFRDRPDSDKSSQTFVMEFKSNGTHKSHVRHHSNFPEAASETPVATSGISIVNASDFDGSKKDLSTGAIVGISLGTASLMAILLYILNKQRSQRGFDTPKNQTRDGIIVDDKTSSGSRSPPASSFSAGKGGMLYGDDASTKGYEENLKSNQSEDSELV